MLPSPSRICHRETLSARCSWQASSATGSRRKDYRRLQKARACQHSDKSRTAARTGDSRVAQKYKCNLNAHRPATTFGSVTKHLKRSKKTPYRYRPRPAPLAFPIMEHPRAAAAGPLLIISSSCWRAVSLCEYGGHQIRSVTPSGPWCTRPRKLRILVESGT